MKRGKSDSKLENFNLLAHISRQKSIPILIVIFVVYILFVTLEIPMVLNTGLDSVSQELLTRPSQLQSEEDLQDKESPTRPFSWVSHTSLRPTNSQRGRSILNGGRRKIIVSRLAFDPETFDPSKKNASLELNKAVQAAWEVGKKMWEEIKLSQVRVSDAKKHDNQSESCPHAIAFSGSEFLKKGKVMELPCGLTLGSHVTVVGKPRGAHIEEEPKISMVRGGGEVVIVSQFMVELQGLKSVEREDPPRILHFNPRLKGDWSGKPVIEQNTCYRMQWGNALRCEGWKSKGDEETVDGMVKCEKWIRDDDNHMEESKPSWWFKRLIGRYKKPSFDWPFPFEEEKLSVLTLSAGLEGYHVNVDGRHITSFPYHTGFTLEDATGLTVNGDIDVHSLFAGSLPLAHPNFAPQKSLEMSDQWRASPIIDKPVELFIGILSAGNHFSERMAVRKSWMQHKFIKSSSVVARFFVALNARKEVNLELKREAEFFGDIIVVPYMDNYDLVVLKTVAICEYGVRRLHAKYVMKGDDDTFVRVDAIITEANKVHDNRSLYVGNINYYHKPLRHGKWAVTYEEWPEEDYPPYANGPGYVLSSDIANFIVSEFEKHKLRLFKMEDVSVGMWVEQFNGSKPVEYVHSLRFCQFGCIEGYYTAHYQSPRQMICLWGKWQSLGIPRCCNMR